MIYPRVSNTRPQPKWAGIKKGPKCCVCGAPATHHPIVEVNLFRGDDMGPYKACDLHKADAQALLDSQNGAHHANP